MGRWWGNLGVALAVVALDGCSVLSTEVNRGHSELADWPVATAYTTADVRVITTRTHPVMHNPVLCTEPSPDIAKAVGAAFSLSASEASKASVGGGGSSAESLAELAGRSTALVGLRDALYRACEAYANGTIGQDAYGLILSRYHSLMASLFLGQDVSRLGTETVVAPASAKSESAAGNAPSSSGGGVSGGGASGGGAPGGGTPARPGPAAPAKTAASVPATPASPVATQAPAAEWSRQSGLIHVADRDGATGADAPAATPAITAGPAAASDRSKSLDKTGAATASGARGRSGTPQKPADPEPAKPQADPNAALIAAIAKLSDAVARLSAAPSGAAANAQVVAALALTRINEDYADQDMIGTLIVACINEYDPTRFRPGAASHNEFLEAICKGIMTPVNASTDGGSLPPGILNNLVILERVRGQARASNAGKVNPEVAAGVAGNAVPPAQPVRE